VCLKSASKQVGDRQVSFKKRTKKLQFRVENNSLVLGGREWTPHDLRRTGATMMQELKVPIDMDRWLIWRQGKGCTRYTHFLGKNNYSL
jgi:integrase